jgi:hypothetical protein
MTKLKNTVEKLNVLIKEGKIMEAFEKYYGEDVTIHENGSPPIKGKDENRKRGIKFLWEVDEIYSAEIKSVAFEKNLSMTEWTINVKLKDGSKKIIYRVNVQTWKDYKIISERLYFCKE